MKPEDVIKQLLDAISTISYDLDITALDPDDYAKVCEAENAAQLFLGLPVENYDLEDEDDDWEEEDEE